MDGLLGIGAAGGGKSSDEGAMLNARLNEMRKERDARAKEMSKQQSQPQQQQPVMVAENTPEPMTSIPEIPDNELPPPPPSSPNASRKPNRAKNKKKKKKKARR